MNGLRGVTAAHMVVLAWLALDLQASLAGPAALVLEIEGARQAEVEAFDELSTGMSLELGEGGRIVFQHYATCDEVTVIGGKLGFSERRYLVRNGKVVDVSRGRCPETVDLRKSLAIGGVLLRSGPGGPKLALKPVFVLTGDAWRAVGMLRVHHGGALVVEITPEGREVPWPEAADPLVAGRKYEIELVPRGEGEARREKVTAHRNAGPLMLLRLD